MSLRSVLRVVLVAAVVLISVAPATAQPDAELNRCVPAGLRHDSVSFRTEDHVVLRGLVLGSGTSGVLLAPGATESVCAWLPLARELADDGYRVLLYQSRSGPIPTGAYRYDLDLRSAALELGRLGATSTVVGGAGIAATAVAATAEKIRGLKGMILLAPFAITRMGTDLDAVAGVRAVHVPSFIAASEDDVIDLQELGMGRTHMADYARQVAGAASDGRLEIVPGAASGVVLTENSAMRDKVRAFVRQASPPPTFVERWKAPISGVVLFVLLAAGVVLLRRRNTTTPPDVSTGS
ncbi:hypothetical protein [Lentzea californiensis]|uniref:hypothetical protein n=1 Tax=Lentzea californiensis TaxID=438851 RepID=UPI002164E35E|nr:hypothetical protein [Lentzea californiensis]MCR3748523.1 Alpha/beta hydrolase family protein [Lentzea californiensis]